MWICWMIHHGMDIYWQHRDGSPRMHMIFSYRCLLIWKLLDQILYIFPKDWCFSCQQCDCHQVSRSVQSDSFKNLVLTQDSLVCATRAMFCRWWWRLSSCRNFMKPLSGTKTLKCPDNRHGSNIPASWNKSHTYLVDCALKTWENTLYSRIVCCYSFNFAV